MNTSIHVAAYHNPAFPLLLACTDHGICNITFAVSQRFDVFKQQFDSPAEQTCPYLKQLERELDSYFQGALSAFKTPIDIIAGTSFQRSVWQALRTIPCGEVRTYGQIAGQMGNPGAARAVGSANGANPLPILIPCHRVIAAGNRIGGFGAGVDIKRALLQLEGVNI
ncbi:MAG: methylated-DNA--[protein]-cysteine S-methyltransferase [candidate division KSB1 bacterium]|nr:methylated-DNA--[protein]-cysteine S-methyltransferase [candidate division KSB1 bacterium]